MIEATVKSIVMLAGNVEGFFFLCFFFFKYQKSSILTSFDGIIIEPSKFI